MRFSRLITKTMRRDPAEAETPSHRYMLKAGMVFQVAAGVYSYLPLAWRSLRKIEAIIREEMDAAGGQEVRMPVLQPMELWEESGRKQAFGDNLFTLHDRRRRPMVMAPTHEEVISLIAKAHVQSYRDLPRIPYQIQTKFRDEPRSRGGLIRVREFDMKDAYSMDADAEGLDASYKAMAQAYRNIYRRCGLPAVMVEADSGAIGGRDSHEFILPASTGEDTILRCAGCGYAANLEKAQGVKPPQPVDEPLPLKEVSTPGVKTIADLCEFLGVPESRTLKAVFYSADGETVFVTIRGDLEVNEVKLTTYLKVKELRLASEEETEAAGLVAGSASAVGLKGIRCIMDDSVMLGSNLRRRRQQAGRPPAERQPSEGLPVGRGGGHRAGGGGPTLRPMRRTAGSSAGDRSGAHLQARHLLQRDPRRLLPGWRRQTPPRHHGLLRHRRRAAPRRRHRAEPRRERHHLPRAHRPLPGAYRGPESRKRSRFQGSRRLYTNASGMRASSASTMTASTNRRA